MVGREDLAREAWLRVLGLIFTGDGAGRFPRIAAELKLSPGQLRAVLDLRDGPLPMRALADSISCDASYATNLIDTLERAGHVERHSTPDDRRVKLVHLTASGERVRAEAVDLLSEPPATFGRLSATQLRELSRLLDVIVDDFPF